MHEDLKCTKQNSTTEHSPKPKGRLTALDC